MHTGYIKLWRQFLEWQWFQDSGMVHFFIYLMIRASHKDQMYQGYQVPRGSLVFGRRKASKDTGLTEQQIRTKIFNLKTTHQITIKTTNRFSIITLLNYDRYQTKNYEDTTQNNQQNNQQTTNRQPRIKNDKNVKKYIHTECNPLFWEFKKLYPKCLAFKRTQGVFEKLNVDDRLWGEMKTALIKQKASEQWKRNNGQYIPASYKWLEEERWRDSIPNQEEPRHFRHIA